MALVELMKLSTLALHSMSKGSVSAERRSNLHLMHCISDQKHKGAGVIKGVNKVILELPSLKLHVQFVSRNSLHVLVSTQYMQQEET